MQRDELIQKTVEMQQNLSVLREELMDLEGKVLQFRPGEGKWNIPEILEHLLLSEHLSLTYCKKKLSFNPVLPRAGLKHHAALLVLKLTLASPLKFKAPANVAVETGSEPRALESIFKEWKFLREEVQRFFEQMDEKYLDKAVFKHPFGYRFSWFGMLEFFEAHYRHHYRQIKRILRDAGQSM